MNKRDKEILLKILKHAENVSEFCSSVNNQTDFESDNMIMSASAFELLQIGELAKKS